MKTPVNLGLHPVFLAFSLFDDDTKTPPTSNDQKFSHIHWALVFGEEKVLNGSSLVTPGF
jgi:hypothetical protein